MRWSNPAPIDKSFRPHLSVTRQNIFVEDGKTFTIQQLHLVVGAVTIFAPTQKKAHIAGHSNDVRKLQLIQLANECLPNPKTRLTDYNDQRKHLSSFDRGGRLEEVAAVAVQYKTIRRINWFVRQREVSHFLKIVRQARKLFCAEGILVQSRRRRYRTLHGTIQNFIRDSPKPPRTGMI